MELKKETYEMLPHFIEFAEENWRSFIQRLEESGYSSESAIEKAEAAIEDIRNN